MKQINSFLIAKKMVAPDVFHLFFYTGEDGFEYKPGQYIILNIPNSPSPLKRLYSLAGSNSNRNILELLIKLIPGGAASEYIRTMCVGDSVSMSGPAGLFSQQKTLARKIFMATGTGIAPILSFLASEEPESINSVLFWGLKNLAETYMIDTLLKLKQNSSRFSFTYCLSQQTSFDTIPAELLQYFRNGHIDTVWSSLMPIVDVLDEYYLCGSRTIIESLRLLLLSRGVPKNNLFFEKY